MKTIYKYFIVITLLSTLIYCDYRPSAMGYQYRIFIFGDSLLWLDVKDQMTETFNNYIYTPRAERSYVLEWRPLSQLNSLNSRMNLFFIGTTEPGTEGNDYLLQVVPPEFIETVNSGENFYFYKDNLFSDFQVSLFMMAKDRETFKEKFTQLEEQIFNSFEDKYFARLGRTMYEHGYNTEIEEFLRNNYGYTIKAQADYIIANQEPQEKYVWLRRFDPDRWVSIWSIAADSSFLNYDSLKKARNQMAAKYYGGDLIVDDETELKQVNFQDELTFKMEGTWRNDSLFIGGPFRTYVKHYKPDSLYFIDIAVMAPEEKKKPYLDQLEVIASTFRSITPESNN